MKTKIKKIHKVNPIFLVPQAIILIIIYLFFTYLAVPKAWILAVCFYFLLAVYLKILVPKWHRKGLFYLRKGKTEAAAICFKNSANFFVKHKWLDDYRSIFLLSISQLSYREMAMINMIYCYNRLGKKDEEQKTFELLKKEYPNTAHSIS